MSTNVTAEARHGFGIRWLTEIQTHGHLIVAFILTAAVASRGVAARPLSFDEFFSLQAVTLDPLARTAELPLIPYYLLLWLWTLGGSLASDAWLRMFSVLAVAIAAVAAAGAAATLKSRRAGYVAGVLMALAPAVQAAGQDARPYAVGMALFATSTWFLAHALKVGSNSSWMGYGTSVILGAVVMPQGLIALLPQAALVWARKGKGGTRPWVIALIPTFTLTVVGLVVLVVGPFSGMHGWTPRPELLWLANGLLWVGNAEASSFGASEGFALGVIVLGLLSRDGRYLTWGAVLTAPLIWLLSQGPASFWMGRSFVAVVPVVVIAAALAVADLQRAALVSVIAVLVMASIPAYTTLRLPREGYADMRKVVEIIEGNANSNDSMFGNASDGYGLHAALVHYGQTGLLLDTTIDPKGDFWLLYGEMQCDAIAEWDVGGDMTLRRCAAPAS